MPAENTATSQDIVKDVDALQAELERLRTSYEQYFLGLEKREPAKLREKVLGLIRKYSNTPIQNARAKFKYQQLVARYNSFTTYWDRILKEIEEGRYERDVFKAFIHEKERKQPPVETKPAEKSTTKQSKDPMELIFQKYVEERKKNKEDVANLSFQKFKTQLQGQIETLKTKVGAGNIKIVVASENGKAKIRALPNQKKN